ncbi:MAG: Rieske 2Fe-2S domain-containing protein [Candidatus Marinimicrobia bacterium]|nr:Rieske 2Fe-2S domain-containing protein [Candidatus Neomarinimicrobiota bacterium]MBL7010955.1 Rieske 2Fe-2S domain-containing protein [Candidatus Neomarinimicrobiota bacterium]MBL7031274.1 Rieske 2Fe-2S domain-containing protein [Candidatus Neomarinimicrobiota bacterium]
MIKVAKLSEVPDGGSKVVMANDIPVALFNIKGKIHAWDNRCPHRGASLADGNISDQIIQCKFHLWEFHVEKACAIANPKIKVKSFSVEIQEGDIYIDS